MSFDKVIRFSAVVAVTVVSSTQFICAEPLTLAEGERAKVMKRLDVIEGVSNDRISGLYKRALQDYRAAVNSDSDTMELYLKCIEKVNFEDKHRKSSDFREWKDRNKEELRSGSLRVALRHQLIWLMLSIEAASSDGNITDMADKAMAHIDNVFEHADQLTEHQNVLNKNATSSIFAQAYELDIKIKDWPKSSLDIANIYDKLVMPPLRSTSNIETLRKAWDKRIEHSGLKVEKWVKKTSSRVGTKDGIRPPEVEKFLQETKPELLWAKEKDCFAIGDEQRAANNMLKILEGYVTHKKAPSWITEMRGLIAAEEEIPDTPQAAEKAGYSEVDL